MPDSATAAMTDCRNSRRASGSSEATGCPAGAVRTLRQSECQSQLGLLSAGELPGLLAEWQPELVDPVPGEGLIPARVELASELERLGDREAAVERMLLRDEPEPRQQRRRLVARREAEHAHLARGRPGQTDRELQQGGLAGAIRRRCRHRARWDRQGAVPRAQREPSLPSASHESASAALTPPSQMPADARCPRRARSWRPRRGPRHARSAPRRPAMRAGRPRCRARVASVSPR